MPIITARYYGNCNMCSGRITPGSRIVRVGEEAYSHINCNPSGWTDTKPGRGPATIRSGEWRNQGAGGWKI